MEVKSSQMINQDTANAVVAWPYVDPNAPHWKQFLQLHRVEIVALIACSFFVLLVLELVRQNRIKEKYSFLWLLTGCSLIVLTLKRDWLALLSNFVGVYYPPTALFLVLSFFILIILIHYSIVLTKLLTQNQRLAQKIALLEADLEAFQKKHFK